MRLLLLRPNGALALVFAKTKFSTAHQTGYSHYIYGCYIRGRASVWLAARFRHGYPLLLNTGQRGRAGNRIPKDRWPACYFCRGCMAVRGLVNFDKMYRNLITTGETGGWHMQLQLPLHLEPGNLLWVARQLKKGYHLHGDGWHVSRRQDTNFPASRWVCIQIIVQLNRHFWLPATPTGTGVRNAEHGMRGYGKRKT